MAQKNILNQVKTATGYDTLYPLTPYQIHQAKTVTGNGSNYAITIDLPAENITVPIIISFTPNVANLANCTVSVNNLDSKPIYINGMPAISGSLITDNICLIQYDVNSVASHIIWRSNLPSNGDVIGGTTSFSGNVITFDGADGSRKVTTFNTDGSIIEVDTRGDSTTTIQTIFNMDGSITEVVS